jgi:integrase/recombinase XerD
MTALAPTLQAFFTDRLIRERAVSPNTIAAYRDTMRLLLGFASDRLRKEPFQIDLSDLDAELIGHFLEHLERDRGCSAQTRNCRLTAIRSLLRYAARRHPEHALVIERVLAIPPKRRRRALITFLTEPEIDALLDAPDRSTWTGRRDQAMLALGTQTGLRASELIGLAIADVKLGISAHVNCIGKGRKQRITPLTKPTVVVLRAWLAERRGQPPDPLFPTSQGRQLSRDALERRLAKHAATAAERCPSLETKRITPHVLRHYVDSWVMWPAAMFRRAAPAAGARSGHITRGGAAKNRLSVHHGEVDSHAGNSGPRRVGAGDRRVDGGGAVDGDDQASRGGVQRVRQVPRGSRPGGPDRGGLPGFHC